MNKKEIAGLLMMAIMPAAAGWIGSGSWVVGALLAALTGWIILAVWLISK